MYSSADPRNKPGFGGKIPHLPKLLDQVREVLWMKHYSIRTEQAYVNWIHPVREIYETDSRPAPNSHGVKRYIFFHNKRHPAEMGEAEIRSFGSWQAINQ